MTKCNPLPPSDELLRLFSYAPKTGIVRWRARPRRSRVVIGSEVKSTNVKGYRRVNIKGKSYRLHLVIWKMVTGRDPENEIDHRDTNKTNNRWVNLREAERHQNGSNMGLTSRNTSGFKGVTRVPSGKWKASIRYKGVLIHLGHHETREQAHAAYAAKARELLGEFARVE